MDRTNAERQARFRQRQKELIEAGKRAAEELARAKRGDAGSTAAAEELKRLRGENADLRQRAADAEKALRLRRQPAAAQAKPAKPKEPPPPATESEEVAALQK
jgi:hypothetical protein